MTLRKKYHRYAGGGNMDYSAIASAVGTGIDAVAPPNKYGRQSTGASIGKGAASGAALGTSIMPGWGTAIGAVVGGAIGWIGGAKAKKREQQMLYSQKLASDQQLQKRSMAILSNNPALVTGKMGEELYGSGGFLKSKYYDAVKATGGNLKPMSSTSAEVQGPSHEQGGVDIPAFNSEVEGKETIQDNYVFSDRLGFAKMHKKLARAIGKIEEKPATSERINSLRRMNQQVEALKAQQEQIRQQYNLQ